MLTAIAHIFGTIGAVLALDVVFLAVSAWETGRLEKARVAEVSIYLGLPVGEINDERHTEKLMRFSAERFSSELFQNRLSDFFGLIHSGWGWCSNASQVCVFVGVVLCSLSDASFAVHSWWVVVIKFTHFFTTITSALLCRLLTGRYPGEAHQARKQLANLWQVRRSPAELE
jgi:hypothetical protein